MNRAICLFHKQFLSAAVQSTFPVNKHRTVSCTTTPRKELKYFEQNAERFVISARECEKQSDIVWLDVHERCQKLALLAQTLWNSDGEL